MQSKDVQTDFEININMQTTVFTIHQLPNTVTYLELFFFLGGGGVGFVRLVTNSSLLWFIYFYKLKVSP